MPPPFLSVPLIYLLLFNEGQPQAFKLSSTLNIYFICPRYILPIVQNSCFWPLPSWKPLVMSPKWKAKLFLRIFQPYTIQATVLLSISMVEPPSAWSTCFWPSTYAAHELWICQTNHPKAEMFKTVSRLVINHISAALKHESALSLWHANVFKESLVLQGLFYTHLPGCSPTIDKWKTTLNILNRHTLFFLLLLEMGKFTSA